MAADLTNETPISSNDAGDVEEYEGTAEQCADLPDGVAPAGPGEVLWHFIVNQSSTDDQTVTATFTTAGILTQGPDKVVDSFVLHYYFRTGSPDTLLSATSSGDGMLLLSHFCNGGPPPEIPEAPASILLVVTGALAAAGFVAWQMRRSAATA